MGPAATRGSKQPSSSILYTFRLMVQEVSGLGSGLHPTKHEAAHGSLSQRQVLKKGALGGTRSVVRSVGFGV